MTTFLSQGIDYLGFLDAKLRDLQGYATLAHELIQNADDAHATSMSFDVRDEALVVENASTFSDCGLVEADECPWKNERGHRCDFHRFRKVAGGDKREQEGTTGAFGIGFISVYQITDSPQLLSGRRHWIIRPDAAEQQRIEVMGVAGEPLMGTCFILPWATDETSRLRQRLRVQAVRMPEIASIFIDVLTRTLPNAILFLKHVRRIELRRNGAVVTAIQRDDDGDQVVVQSGEDLRLWRILRGSFDVQAADLKKMYSGQIEPKRKAHVTVALPEHAAHFNGLFCACLPTEQHTELPFHINADFYPSTDRKRILLTNDHQGEWNRAAIAAAANLVAAALPSLSPLLGREPLWDLLSRLEKLHSAADDGQQDPVFKAFWTAAQPCIEASSIVALWPDGWRKPAEIFLLEQEKEEAALPLLDAIGFEIVHPELRRHFGLLRSVGVRVLGLADLVQTLQQAGLDEAVALEEAPAWIQSRDARELLSQEITTLSNQRVKREVLELAQQEIRKCAIALARDGYLRGPATLFRPPESDAAMLVALGREDVLIAEDNPAGITALVEKLTPAHMLGILEEVQGEHFELLWREQNKIIFGIVDWFVGQGHVVLNNDALKARLRALPIWPSGESLFPLNDLFVPGTFEDPLGLASILDRSIYRKRSDFLRDIGAKRLTLQRYSQVLIPKALSTDQSIGVAERRQLIAMLAEHLGELSDDAATQAALSGCPLVECQDGIFRPANEVYFDDATVSDGLGIVPFAREAEQRPEATREFYRWLGVADQPRLEDVVQRVNLITAEPPSPDRHAAIAQIFRHLSGRDLKTDGPDIKRLLGTRRWLPAQQQSARWYAPHELYAIYQAYLFESQAIFLDIDRVTQNRSSELINLLDIGVSPSPALVVKHLLWSAAQAKPVNMEVYRFLNDHANEAEIERLRDLPSLRLNSGAYIVPSHAFWGEHPYGRYRVQLSADMRKYGDLLNRIGVQESPSSADALQVMQEITAAFHRTDNALDDETVGVLMTCWQQVGTAFDSGEVTASTLRKLRDVPVIPAPDRQLRSPGEMFLDDRPGIAGQFSNFRERHTIPRILGAWRAMEAAGVRPLSKAVVVTIVECDNRKPATDLLERLHTRRHLIARVAEALSANGGQPIKYELFDALSIDRVSRLMLDYGIRVGSRVWVSVPEDVAAYFDAEHQVLYVQSRNSSRQWAALARELAYALSPQNDAVAFASGLKEVLSAETTQAAAEALSELGYAQLEIIEVETVSQGAVDLGGTAPPVVETTAPNVATEEAITTLNGKAHVEDATQSQNANQGGMLGGEIGDSVDSTDAEATRQMSNRNTAHNRPSSGTRATGISGSNGRDASNTGDAGGVRTSSGECHRASSGESAQDASETSQRQRGRLRTYVTPEGASSGADGSAMADRISAIDRAGIQCVLQYERDAGRYPREMPHQNPGYDIESCDIAGNVVRYIEVKSVADLWDSQGVGLSTTQFNTGHLYNEQYWLYVVERAEQPDAQIYRIQDPTRRIDQFLYDAGWRELAEDEDETTGELVGSSAAEEHAS